MAYCLQANYLNKCNEYYPNERNRNHLMANIKRIHNELLLQNILTDSGNEDDF